MRLQLLPLAGAALLLTGCFDGRYDLTLRNDGAGTLRLDVLLDKDISKEILKAENGKPGKIGDVEKQALLGKNAKSSRLVENGRVGMRQELAFKKLSEVTSDDLDIEVQDFGRNLLGVVHSRVRFGTGRNPSAKPQEKQEPAADAMAAKMLASYSIRVTMHLPCVIDNATSLKNGDTVYAPKIEKSFWNGSTVSWEVPMPAMLAFSKKPKDNDFAATCWSFMGIPAARSVPAGSPKH
jgi:hypothetical protein